MRITGDMRRAYLAGIIDGEGCIFVKRSEPRGDRATPSFHLVVHVSMADREALDLLAQEFGGTVRRYRPQEEGRRAMHRWQVSDAKAEAVIHAVLPFLLVKRPNALNALGFRAHQRTSPKHRTKVTGHREFPNAHGAVRLVENRTLSDEYVARCEEFVLTSKAHNSGRRPARGIGPVGLARATA